MSSKNKGGAPKGNQNAVRGKRWTQAIDRALAKRARGDAVQALDEIAEKFVNAAAAGPSYEKGDPWLGVVGLLGDRLEGKPVQMIAGDPAGAPIVHRIEEVVVDPKS